MMAFPRQEAARTLDFSSNDVGFVQNMAGHYIENTGDEDLVLLELLVASEFHDILLNRWLRALPEQAVMTHTHLKAEEIRKIPTTPLLP